MPGRINGWIRSLAAIAAIGVLAAAAAGCGGDKAPASSPKYPESFTFFDIGVNRADTEDLRAELKSRLGRAAVTGKDILELDLLPKISLADRFPELDRLNRQLNPDIRARREHAIRSLTYRYPQRVNPSFSYARLVFSEKHQYPLVIAVNASSEGAAILETLSEKYGSPRKEQLGDSGRTLWSWSRNGDHMIVLKQMNRFDQPEYLITIFYVRRIQDLIQEEADRTRQIAEERKKAGKSAF